MLMESDISMLNRIKRAIPKVITKQQKPMKIVMTLLLRDEEDILRANIEFHRAMGVDFFIATDNKSVDATAKILKEYERQGLVHYIYEGADDYSQTEWVTKMARLAASEFDATWVINNDADEFWWPMNHSDLRSELDAVPWDRNIVQAERRNFVPVDGSAESFYSAMIYRENVSLNDEGRPLLPKVAHRAILDVTVAQGNHRVWGFNQSAVVHDAIEIQHFPLRSYAQFENKIVKGGQAYERNDKLAAGFGHTWKRLYKEYKKGNLIHYYKKKSYSAERIQQGIDSGELIVEERLLKLLNTLNNES
jgi:hypothetical protein